MSQFEHVIRYTWRATIRYFGQLPSVGRSVEYCLSSGGRQWPTLPYYRETTHYAFKWLGIMLKTKVLMTCYRCIAPPDTGAAACGNYVVAGPVGRGQGTCRPSPHVSTRLNGQPCPPCPPICLPQASCCLDAHD